MGEGREQLGEVQRWAHLSRDGEHRLVLGRRWAEGPLVAFIGLNPSTADADVDDATVRRCMGFARTWGFGGLLIANLFTFRTPDPRLLAASRRPLTLGADNALRDVCDAAILVIEAWGAHAMAADRTAHVREILDGRAPRAVIGLTKDGAPRHPLYAPADAAPLLVAGGSGRELQVLGPAQLPAGSSRWRPGQGAGDRSAASSPVDGIAR